MNFLLLIKLLPEILELIKTAKKRLEEGATIVQVKRSLERVNEAFAKKNRAEGAAMLDSLWLQSNQDESPED